jgi:hypothetical protein
MNIQPWTWTQSAECGWLQWHLAMQPLESATVLWPRGSFGAEESERGRGTAEGSSNKLLHIVSLTVEILAD